MSPYRTLLGTELSGKRVLLRAGFDVPIENGIVTDISRIEAAIPTMRQVLDNGAALIIMAHQDRPKGKVVPDMSQQPLVPILEKLLGIPVRFASSCVGEETKAMIQALSPREVLLLENLRYDAREEKNDVAFAKELASYADIYVNDAFTNCHRTHASMVAVAQLLPAYMGVQLQQEVEHLLPIVESPRHPLTLIICGAKIETKLPVIEHFLKKGDHILVGGAIANTFLAAQGYHVASSLYEADFIPTAQELLQQSGNGNAQIHIPTDVVTATAPDAMATMHRSVNAIAEGSAVFDVGEETVQSYGDIIAASSMVVWNGPLGMYESEVFANASKKIAAAMMDAATKGAITIIGGGDTIDFHTRYSLPMTGYTFVSTGGGAMLEFISGKTLPALEVLRQNA